MLTDEEIDVLAVRAMDKAFANLLANDPNACALTDQGQRALSYDSQSSQGLGRFLFKFIPVDTARFIVRRSALIYEEFLSSTETKTSSEQSDWNVVVGAMSESALTYLFAAYRERVQMMVEEIVEDGLLMALGILSASQARIHSRLNERDYHADARQAIDDAVKRSADKRREMLREHLKILPHVVTVAKRGPRRKTETQWQADREAFMIQLETTYRDLRLELRKKPTMAKVAERLGIGGVNPKRGSDTRTTTLGNKLRKYKIDYHELIAKIEAELHR